MEKKWYRSKVVWEGIGATITGIAGAVIDAFQTGWSAAALVTAILGAAIVISRIWFTDTTLTK